jgi:outer membrane protein OmpA-like peptidoglycan-associated protein
MSKLISRGGRERVRSRVGTLLVTSLFSLLMIAAPASATEGPFVGLNVGASKPVSAFYRSHVTDGVTANPYVGYMFNQYLGVQGEAHFIYQDSRNRGRGFPNEGEETSMVGGTVGPRISVPLGEDLELYGTGQGGVFTGLSGRINRTAGGVSAGAGIDYFLTDHVALSVYGRWNRAFMSPRPTTLSNLVPSSQGPADAQWAVGGIGVLYRFNGPPQPPPPVKVAAAPPPPPPPPPVKKKIVLRSVHFDFDKSNIRADAVPVLDEAAKILKEEGTVAIVVAGHTDSRGSEAYNMKLSQRRADAVRGYLVDHGVAASRITTKGYGESEPVASNDTDEGRAQNRRVASSRSTAGSRVPASSVVTGVSFHACNRSRMRSGGPTSAISSAS